MLTHYIKLFPTRIVPVDDRCISPSLTVILLQEQKVLTEGSNLPMRVRATLTTLLHDWQEIEKSELRLLDIL